MSHILYILDPSHHGDVSLYSWRQQCLDIVKILDHEKLQHAVAIGHDWYLYTWIHVHIMKDTIMNTLFHSMCDIVTYHM